LAHLAFWDQRFLVLLERWEQSPSAVRPPRTRRTSAGFNDAGKPLLLALAPRRAAELAVAIAEEVDGKAASAGRRHAGRGTRGGQPLNLVRAEHRREHLGEIEQVLAGR